MTESPLSDAGLPNAGPFFAACCRGTAVRVPAGQRDRLERVCRYALRPPVASLSCGEPPTLTVSHPAGEDSARAGA